MDSGIRADLIYGALPKVKLLQDGPTGCVAHSVRLRRTCLPCSRSPKNRVGRSCRQANRFANRRHACDELLCRSDDRH